MTEKMQKYSKSNQDPHQSDQDKTEIEKILAKKSEHFEPGTWVMYKNEKYLILCYRESDGKMIIDNENSTHALDTYSMSWRNQ